MATVIKINNSKKFKKGLIVEQEERSDEKTVTYRLSQEVMTTYTSGQQTSVAGEINLFDDEDTVESSYTSKRYAWQRVPKRKFPTVESFQAFLNTPEVKEDYFIREVYGLNPLGLDGGFEASLEKKKISMEKILDTTMKMKGSADKLTPMMTTHEGKQVHVFSVNKLVSSKAVGGKTDLDFGVESLQGGKYKVILSEMYEDNSVEAFETSMLGEAVSEWD
jgi:hypothetical protein